MQSFSANFSIKILKKGEFSVIICFTNAHHVYKVSVLELLTFIKVTTRFLVYFHAIEGRKSDTTLLSNCAVQSKDHRPFVTRPPVFL
jgi:hypothetical protein